jgi:ABC-type lipoprotein export system ATPase subunit/class 3 adenylate cyclase
MIRRVEVQDFCVGSPERTPHIVVQQLIPAGNERALELPLGSGNYRVRALELQGSQSLSVSANGKSSATIVISKEGWNQQELNISKRTSLTLKNETDSEQLLILERMAWSDQAATAAEVTALQIFRDLFSTEALRPGEHISVGTQTVLFTDLRHSTRLYREIGDATAFGRVMNHFDVLKKVIAEHDGAIVKTIGDAVMAVFRCPANALVAMLDAQSALANPGEGAMPLLLKAGLHSGPCIAVTLNDRLDYFGSTVNMAARLEGLSSGSEVIISRTVFEDSKVIELLKSEMYEALPFEMTLKGFEEEQAELWRVRRVSCRPDRRPRTKDQTSYLYPAIRQRSFEDLPDGTNSVTALDNVSIDINEGEFVAIQGTSGSGKSTLLNMLGGLDHPSRGEVFFATKALGPFSKREMARYRRFSVGMIFQNFNLIPTMSAEENVALALAFGGLRGQQRHDRAGKLLARVGLSDRMSHRPSELSGGEQQRVAIARALANNPKVLLADEPTGNLDSIRAHELLGLLRDMVNQDSLTTLMVTHDHELANSFADRIVFMKDGKVI